MRFVVSGGGTGGHIYPALAIAKGLTEAYPDAEVLYIGTEKGMEAEIVPKEEVLFKGITASGLKRKLSLGNFRVLWQAGRGFGQAMKLIRQWQPQAVIGTGGYVCGPVVLAAAMSRVPTLIHEQNAYPGITNRALALVADCVAVTFADSLKYFPKRAQIKLTGLPVRTEVLTADREKSLRRMGFKKDSLVLLSFGGSRGARAINEAMIKVIEKFGNNSQVNIIHITGILGYQEFIEGVVSAGIVLDKLGNITIKDYIYNMHDVLAVADLVISRAGATTLAELTAMGIPSILVPYPYAAENHQEFNARALEKEGAALVLLDKDLNGQLLCDKIAGFVNERERLAVMSAACRNMGRTDALKKIITCVESLLSG